MRIGFRLGRDTATLLAIAVSLAAILFDKDGTLIDFDASWGGAAHAVMTAMTGGDAARFARLAEAMHYRPEARRFLPTSPMIAGATADYLADWAAILDRDATPDLAAEMDRRFATEVLASLAPLGDPRAVFAALRDRGLKLGLATNDGEASARQQCDKLGLAPFLDFVAGYDTGHGRKPDPGMVHAFSRAVGIPELRIAVVGDSVHDLEAARAAGAQAVAVLTGPASRAVLAPHAHHVIADLGDLMRLLPTLDAAC